MSRLDQIVTTDLAALAADRRRQVPSVDDLLREAMRGRRKERAVPTAEVAWLSFGRAFAHRVGRAAAGAMAVKYTAAVLVVLYGPLVDEHRRRTWMLADDVISIVARGLVLILAAYVIAMKLGQRRFERVLARLPAGADTSARVARMVRSVDGWSVGLVIAGATSMVTLIVVGTLVVGWDGWDRFWCFGCDPEEAIFHDRLHDLTAVIVCIAVAAVAIGWACARSRGVRWLRVLEHRFGVPAALLVGAAAVWGWVASASSSAASSGLRTALTVVVASALFGVVSGVVMRSRRREEAGLEVAQGALGGADERVQLVVGLAGVYRLRVARMIGGAVALGYAIAMVAVLHDPLGGNVGMRRSWRDWFVHGRIDRLVLVLVLTLKAYAVAAHLAGRVFEARVGRSREPVELGRTLALGVDGWSVVMGIAGASAVVCVLAMIKVAVGDYLWVFFQSRGPRVEGALKDVLRDLVLVCTFVVTASLAIGRACACGANRSRWLCALEHRAAIPVGVLVGLVAAVVGRRLDFGVFDISLPAVARPSTGTQVLLCLLYATAAVLIAGGYTARRRRAEHKRLGLPQ